MNTTKRAQTKEDVVFAFVQEDSFGDVLLYNQSEMSYEDALKAVKSWPISHKGACMLSQKCFELLFKPQIDEKPVQKPKYMVVTTYSFDSYMTSKFFETEEEAVAYLKESYEAELDIDQIENGWDTTSERSEDGWYAKITNHFSDHDDVTEFRVGSV